MLWKNLKKKITDLCVPGVKRYAHSRPLKFVYVYFE